MTDYFAAFFPKGVRANNTSIHSAMSTGAVVVTNLDQASPSGYRHMETLIDIEACTVLPTETAVLQKIGEKARAHASKFGWQALAERLLERDEIALARAPRREPQSIKWPSAISSKS
jgi:hypothetical protein